MALGLAACNPFGDTSTELVLNAEQAASFDLLTPHRRLPASARDVRVSVDHFLDTSMRVRFDAPLAEARKFARAMTGRPPAREGTLWDPEPSIDWWPTNAPPGVESANEDNRGSVSGSLPPIRVFIQPRGQMATVWVHTFTT